MAKGFFTQGVCLLTNGETTMDQLKFALSEGGFEIVKEVAGENWTYGGNTLIVPYAPDVNGYVAIDLVNRVWPDSMGDTKTETSIFSAWAMGHFGPYAFPGGLERAQQHSWSWEEGRDIAKRHRGFIRVRISYIFGAEDQALVMPPNYDPVAEMMFVSRMVAALIGVTGVVCYFNPNGEVVKDSSTFGDVWSTCFEQELLPLPLWSNIRFFNLSEELAFMDSVGNSQFDVRDVEAIFSVQDYEPGDVDYYLRNVTHYLLGVDREMSTGESIDGPGETDLSWMMEVLDEGTVQPPRKVLRLFPKSIHQLVQKTLSDAKRS